MIAKEIQELENKALALQDTGLSRRAALRQIIEAVEEGVRALVNHTGPHPFALDHQFADGIYKRTIFPPARAFVVGMIHRKSHFCFIEEGEVSVLTEDGPIHIKGPFGFRSPAGSKRVVYHHTDTIWTTYHATDETDVKRIEFEIIAPSYEMLGEVA